MAVESEDRRHGHRAQPHAEHGKSDPFEGMSPPRAEANDRQSGAGSRGHPGAHVKEMNHAAFQPPREEAKPAPDASTDRIAQLEAAIADLEDRLKRSLADQDNSRKRTERDAQTKVKFATSGWAIDLLPTLDNLQSALKAAPEEGALTESMKRLLQGVRVTEQALLSTMKKHGITPIESLGEPFDRDRHEAVAEIDSKELPAGTVTAVLQPGYLHHDRLLRPAMVHVAKSSSRMS
jgi:molecular chaperone GrpE